ncbi:NUDIX hydrolase [Alkalihalobacillus sp. AL-G]|uniref:NUDIX hydrolase n=1 Tax=Alkalihalobacillus sp. AL-G TaxID=2926399 RepID=UPI002729F8D3|nr:NUDIX hydrolase [Alkalihalobacillus sp. AL-G]WLD94307.1 NUDIX hydrolase [Alkalihalobacillus sp. AL-G]
MKKLVKILVVNDENIILVKQYREQIQRYTIELPGGKVKRGETSSEAAVRELAEETGIQTDSLIDLGSYINSQRSIMVSFFFTDSILEHSQQKLDNDEDIQVLSYSMQSVINNLSTKEWNDLRISMALSISKSKGLI